MARPWRIRYAGAKYHVTVRGNGRATVFLDTDDYRRFLAQLDEAREEDGVVLYAYVLMPNHYHLFVETPQGNIQRFMQRLNTAYSMYFRYKHQRPGHCFQGRYGAKVVEGDNYILGLTRYIHLNPVKIRRLEAMTVEGLANALDQFVWSSYRGYAGLASPEARIDYRWLKILQRVTMHGNRNAYRRYVLGALADDDNVFLKEAGKSRYAIGDERFVASMEDELREKRMERAVTGDIVWPEDRLPSLDDVSVAVAEELGIGLAALRSHGHSVGDRKVVAVELCCRLSNASQRDVGRCFAYGSESSVGKARKRARVLLDGDPTFAAKLSRITKRLKTPNSSF